MRKNENVVGYEMNVRLKVKMYHTNKQKENVRRERAPSPQARKVCVLDCVLRVREISKLSGLD